MKGTIPIDVLLKQIRPLPWPVSSKVADNGALSLDQLAATRIYRRYAANQFPRMLETLSRISKFGQFKGEGFLEMENRKFVPSPEALIAQELLSQLTTVEITD